MQQAEEELIKYVVEKAKREAEEIIKKAEEEAKQIIEKAIEEKRQRVEIEKKKVEEEAKAIRERIVSEARRKASFIVTEVMSKALEEAERRAWELLDAMSPELRKASLRYLAKEAISVLSSQGGSKPKRVKLIVSLKDYSQALAVAEELRNELEIETEVKIGELKGGVLVEVETEGLAIDNSYESRLRKALKSLALEMGAELRREALSRRG
ncbi:MAG: V-type ATP synthase subunit E family protein [Acidilobaceae archaeon]